MTDQARIHLPRIVARRCLKVDPGSRFDWIYCDRAWGHTGRHAATDGTSRRIVRAVWA